LWCAWSKAACPVFSEWAASPKAFQFHSQDGHGHLDQGHRRRHQGVAQPFQKIVDLHEEVHDNGGRYRWRLLDFGHAGSLSCGNLGNNYNIDLKN
jgi:hypothetical protein